MQKKIYIYIKNRINPNLSPWESRKIYIMCYSGDMPSCVFVDRDERSLMKIKASSRQEALVTILYVPWRYINEVQRVPGEDNQTVESSELRRSSVKHRGHQQRVRCLGWTEPQGEE